MKIRHFWVLAHRYTGLALTAFLIVVGLSGSMLAFFKELDTAINPGFFVSAQSGKPVDPANLLETAENLDSAVRADAAWIGDTAAIVTVSPRSAAPAAYDQLIFNPYNGELLGRRSSTDLSHGIDNLMPFIYRLHYALALDELGGWILGVSALLWTLDCFVGFYLTLPATGSHRAAHNPPGKSYRRRWQAAWLVKWSASGTRINYDLHRAGGLWFWPMLLIFAWSSVYMNLSGVYDKLMKSLGEYHQPWTDFPDLPQPLQQGRIGWRQAREIAESALNRLSLEQGIIVHGPSGFWINRAKGFYVYDVRSSADIQERGGNTRVVVDAENGSVKQVLLATGQYSGNTITSWLLALHTANIWGMPYKILVCLLGMAITMLSLTGLLIWLKKRRRHRSPLS
ncbi:PepSY domain-containing protein [Methylomonas sp. SURF-2]|uniref:PepSY domain-containing protein n=1 Tax=Methylomonas subterranea TaxID=2952225 RepID=A0ABT1THE7_9GAMM|nr:PepSY-associated TM helix domain-containing protein [Methylomonas sp. SURF-2]MCQ8104739.1 PepSY domain-containing protein [Methylomonas sp. SURF-2]